MMETSSLLELPTGSHAMPCGQRCTKHMRQRGTTDKWLAGAIDSGTAPWPSADKREGPQALWQAWWEGQPGSEGACSWAEAGCLEEAQWRLAGLPHRASQSHLLAWQLARRSLQGPRSRKEPGPK